MTTKKLCPRGTKIQSLIFSKDKFNTKSAKSWAEKHKFKFGKVDETTNNLRIRQHSPTNFVKTSFRTIGITNGIKAVIGCPVKQLAKYEEGGVNMKKITKKQAEQNFIDEYLKENLYQYSPSPSIKLKNYHIKMAKRVYNKKMLEQTPERYYDVTFRTPFGATPTYRLLGKSGYDAFVKNGYNGLDIQGNRNKYISGTLSKNQKDKYEEGGRIWKLKSVSFWLDEEVDANDWVNDNGLFNYEYEIDEGDVGERVNVWDIEKSKYDELVKLESVIDSMIDDDDSEKLEKFKYFTRNILEVDDIVINDSCVIETIGAINDYSPIEWWFIDDYNYNLVIYFEESFTANDIDNIQDILNQFELCHDIITPEINLQYDKEGRIIYIPLLTNEFTVGKYEDGGKVNLYADLTNDEVLRNYNKLMYEYQKISNRDENWAKDKKDIYLKLIANYKLALEMRGVMSDGGNIESQYSIENILNISGVPEKDREKLINDFRASGYGDTYELIGDFPNQLPLEQKVWVTATNIEEKVNDFKDGENTFLEATLIAEAIHSIYENEEIVSEETEEEETKEETKEEIENTEQAPEKTEDDNTVSGFPKKELIDKFKKRENYKVSFRKPENWVTYYDVWDELTYNGRKNFLKWLEEDFVSKGIIIDNEKANIIANTDYRNANIPILTREQVIAWLAFTKYAYSKADIIRWNKELGVGQIETVSDIETPETQSPEIDDSEVTELVENVYAEFIKLKNDEIFVAFLNELKNKEIIGEPFKYHIQKMTGNGGVQIYVFNPLTLKFTDVPAFRKSGKYYDNKGFLNIPDKELVTFEEYAEGNWKDFNDDIILNNIKSLLKQFKEDKNYIGVEKTASYYLLPEHKQEFIDFAISKGYTNIAYYDGKYFEAGGEVLIGGKADNMSLDDIADMHGVPLEQILRQSRIGLKVEREHTSDMNKVIEIVKDHLYESPLYYTKLQKIESSFETGGTIGDLYLDVPSENNDMFKLYATSEIRGFDYKSGVENNGSFRYVFTSERDLDKAIGVLLRLQNGRGNMPTNLNQLKKMLQVGSLLKLTYNRVRPDRVGKIFVVAKVQSNGLWLIEGVTIPNDIDFKKAIWLEYPKTDEILFNVLGFSIYGKNILNKGTINWTSEYVKMLSYEYILGEQIDIAKATYIPTEQIDDTYVKNQAYLRTVYVNELINLIDDIQTYKMGGGVKPEYFNLNKKIDKDKLLTVSCFIKSKDTNKSLYVRRAEGDHIGYWSLVSGTVEKGEFPEDAIKREIQEELQVKLDFSNLIYVAQTPSPYGVHYYYELTVNEEFEPNLNEENDNFAWLHYGKMPKQTHPLLIKFMKSNVMA